MADTEVAGNARALCRAHKIALNDDGRCMLCRRQNESTPEEPANPWRMIALVALLCCIALAAVALSRATKRDTPVADAVVAPQPVQEEEPADDPGVEAGDPLTSPNPRPSLKERREAFKEEREEREELIEETMREIEITLYTIKECKFCDDARKWLTDNEYAFTELDVGEDGRNLRARDLANPKKSIPTLVVGETVMPGWNQRLMIVALRKEAKALLDE